MGFVFLLWKVGGMPLHHVGTKFRKLPVYLAVTTTITSDPYQGLWGCWATPGEGRVAVHLYKGATISDVVISLEGQPDASHLPTKAGWFLPHVPPVDPR